jgi:outer membrane protein assembly factor BamB
VTSTHAPLIVAGLVAAVLLTACGAPPAAPAPATPSAWPAALHDARHSGASTTDGPTAGHVRWRRTLEAPVASGAVVGRDGTVYTASTAGVLHALDPATGADRWTHDSGRPDLPDADLSISPLVLPDDTVLWGTPAGDLVALSSTGAVLWSQRLSGRPTSPATADGHRVYVGDLTGGVSALDVSAHEHHVAWTLDVGTTSYGSVVTDGSGRLYTTADSALVALDDHGDRGQVAWRADPGDDITEVSAGLAPDGTALLGTNGTREWAYRPDGTVRWTSPAVITYSSPAVTADGYAYLADHAGRVRVLRVADGTEAATHQLVPPSQIWSSVALDRNRRVYLGTQDGHVIGLGPDLAVLFDVDVGGPVDSYPALTADGALIVSDRDARVVAID